MKHQRAPVVVIGAGVAGLAAAVELAARGLAVTVLERGSAPGGKMRQEFAAGRAIDAGPTVLTMRWVFEELFARAGARLEDRVRLTTAEVLARHGWDDGSRLDLYADFGRSQEAVRAFAGADEARGFERFCRDARSIYETLEQPFLRGGRTGPIGLAGRVGLARLPALMRLRPFTSLWRALGEYFSDPRLRQLFARYSTYIGSSPFAAPATLMLIAHVEMTGVWYVDGGMHALARALETLARDCGAQFRYGAEVAAIEASGGAVQAVTLANGERVAAQCVVLNADAAALAAGRFGPQAARAVRPAGAERSLSAITWALAAQTRGFPLLRHNVFFSNDYRGEFDHIFRDGRPPADPTVYVCAQDRADTALGDSAASERLFCLINAPARGDAGRLEGAALARAQDAMLSRLQRCGLQVDAVGPPVITEPADFAQRFPATGGALYGPASHGWRASFLRPGAETTLRGLVLAGGSVHPGAGVPMAALSGHLAALAVLDA